MAAAALQAMQGGNLGMGAQQTANQQLPTPYAPNQQMGGGGGAYAGGGGGGGGSGSGGGGGGGGTPFTNPQMAAALMALNQSSAATMHNSGLPGPGDGGADMAEWAAMQNQAGLNYTGLPDGAQQQNLAAIQSLQNMNPLALQNLLSQVAMAQAQQSFRGGLPGGPPGMAPLQQNQQGVMQGGFVPQQQGMGMAPMAPQVMAQMNQMPHHPMGSQMPHNGFQQQLQRGGGGNGGGYMGGHNDMMGPPFGRGRGNGGGGGMKGGERGRGGGSQGGNGMAVGRGSALLEEFRSSRGGSRKLELRDILGHCEEFCRDQHGSRFIQTKLDSATPAEKQKVFEAVLPVALGLMKDLFGNYVCQKFLERGSPEQREALGNVMRAHVLDLSLDMFGCRVVQKAIEVMEGHTLEALVSQLQGAVMTCVRDQNGNHVIQKCIECSPSLTVQFIVDDFQGQVCASVCFCI